MHLGLNWLAQSLALSLTLNGLINYSYISASLNVFDGKRFENCVNTILSKYPFVSNKDLRKFKKIFHESNSRVKKDTSRLTDGRLSDLLSADDLWRDSREEAYISSIERCSLLATGNPENDLLKELSSLNRYKRHLGSSKSRSKHKKRRHPKSTSKSGSEPMVRKKRDVASHAFASSSASGQGSIQTGNSIEDIIRNTLITSSFFTRVFHTGLLKTDAKLIAEDITKAGLYGYNTAVINHAVNTVTGALSFTTLYTNSENYAFLLAKSISEVLKGYNLMLQANGNQIANNMIREIQRLLRDTSETQTPVKVQQSNQGIAASRDSALVQTSGNNQRQNSPPIQPSPVVMSYPEDKVAIFRNKLTSLLAESRELSDLFCQGSSPNIFQTVKTALSDYGLKISVAAAVAATDAFMTLNSQQSCSQYANILSEVIRDVLFDNALLESVKPEDLASKIASSAKTYSNPSSNLKSEAPKESFKSSLPLLPSFPEVSLPSNDKKEELHDSSGANQKGFLNSPTRVPAMYEVKEQNPPLLLVSKAPTFPKADSEIGFKSVEQLKRNASSGFVYQSYATTPIEISRYSDSQKLPKLSTTRYEFTPTSTMAPQIATTTEYVPDYTQASEFVNSFMRAFEMFTSAPDPKHERFSDDVVGDPKKLSQILEDEMESSVRTLSQTDSSEEKEKDSKSLASSKSRDKVDRKLTNSGEPGVLSKPQPEVRNTTSKNANASVGVAATSSQSGSIGSNPAPKLESSFTPTPVTLMEGESQQERERKSNILKKVSSISTSGIAFIRSPNFNLQELCSTLNELATLVGIEPIPSGNCEKIPLIDFLLHVLREVSSTLNKA